MSFPPGRSCTTPRGAPFLASPEPSNRGLRLFLSYALFVYVTQLQRLLHLCVSSSVTHAGSRLVFSPSQPRLSRSQSRPALSWILLRMGLNQERTGKLLARAETTLDVEEVLGAYVTA